MSDSTSAAPDPAGEVKNSDRPDCGCRGCLTCGECSVCEPEYGCPDCNPDRVWLRTLYNPFRNQHRSPLTKDALTHGEAYLFNNPNHQSEPEPDLYRSSCYICRDPDFAQMGLPLCYPCRFCKGHVAADNSVCDDCGKDQGQLDRIERRF